MLRLNNRGFNLIQVAIFGTIMGIISLGTLKFIAQMGKGVKTNERRNQRDQLFTNIESAVRNPANLKRTQDLTPGSAFGKCALPGGNPNDCTHNVPVDFDVYNVQGQRIAGTTGNPVRYSAEGVACASPSPECPYEAIATFRAQCQSAATCAQPLNILVNLQLRVNQGLDKIDGSNLRLSPKQSTDYTVPIREVATIGAKDCAAGQIFAGLDNQGNAKCEAPAAVGCAVNQYISMVNFASKTVNCTDMTNMAPHVLKSISCSDGYYLRGFNNHGQKICEKAHVNGSCGDDTQGNKYYLAGYDSEGNRVCRKFDFKWCEPGHMQFGINNDGSPYCLKIKSGQCPKHHISIGVDWNLAPFCIPVISVNRCMVDTVGTQYGEQFQSTTTNCEGQKKVTHPNAPPWLPHYWAIPPGQWGAPD